MNHPPRPSDTRGLIGRAEIDALGPDGFLVNLSRGFVVDEDQLIEALREGRQGQAALGVFEAEPTSHERWAGVPNTLLSPHSAGDTAESLMALRSRAISEISTALAPAPRRTTEAVVRTSSAKAPKRFHLRPSARRNGVAARSSAPRRWPDHRFG